MNVTTYNKKTIGAVTPTAFNVSVTPQCKVAVAEASRHKTSPLPAWPNDRVG